MTVQQCCVSSPLQLRCFRKTGASVFMRRQDTFIGPMIRSDATENSDAPNSRDRRSKFFSARVFSREGPLRVNRVISVVGHYFRSSLGSGHRLGRSPCLKAANTGSGASHSIISSASASSFAGISRPSALAALRLITNWNFIACMTGRSAAFSPLRISQA